MAEQAEPGSAVHLPHDPLGSRVDTLGAAVVVRESESGVDGGAVEFEAVREGVQVGQVGGADRGDPVGELGVVALCWGQANSPVRRASLLSSGQASVSSRSSAVSLSRKLSGRVRRKRAKRCGVVTGLSLSARPWVM